MLYAHLKTGVEMSNSRHMQVSQVERIIFARMLLFVTKSVREIYISHYIPADN